MLPGMQAGVFRTAGLLRGREFHEFDAGVVGIVEIELPFAAAADFGLLGAVPAVFDELLERDVNVLDAERSVYLAEDALADSNRFVTQNLISLYKALGGGWETGNAVAGS